MISAAMTGLARLAYEFSDLVSAAYNILPSTFLLLQRKNKEITKVRVASLKRCFLHLSEPAILLLTFCSMLHVFAG